MLCHVEKSYLLRREVIKDHNTAGKPHKGKTFSNSLHLSPQLFSCVRSAFFGTGYHISAVSEHVREHLSSLALRIGSIRKSGSCLPSGNIQHLLTHCCVSLELISAVLAMLMVIKPTCFHLISCFHCFTGNIKKRGRSLLCFPILPLRTILPLRSRN